MIQPTFKFELTPAEVEVISRALGRQPYDDVVAVVQRMQAQINVQNAIVDHVVKVRKRGRRNLNSFQPTGANGSAKDAGADAVTGE